MNMNMNMMNNNIFNNNAMSLNSMTVNNNSMSNNLNNNTQFNSPFFNNNNNNLMPSPFYFNSFFPNINPLPLPNSYPIMNNTLNVNRFNFIGINSNNNNNNNNINNNLNNSINSLSHGDSIHSGISLGSYISDIDDDNYSKLKKQFMKELDTYQYKNKDKFDSSMIEDECSICLCKYKITDMLTLLPCKHGFHKKCIKKWLSNDEHNKCPLCNLDIKAEINKRKADLEKHIYDAEHEDD